MSAGSRALALLGLLALTSCSSSAPRAPESAEHRAPEPAGNPAEEIVAAQAKLASDSTDAEAWFRLALAWHQDDRLGHLDSSLAAFEHLLKLEPNNVQAIVHHGLALEDAERYDDALAEYQRATTLAPDDPLPYINLGALLYFQFKRIYDAKVALTKAISLKSDSADAHFNLGVLFADANLFREAKVEWERVLEISPTGAAANLARENLERIRPFLEQQEEGAAAPAGGLPTEAPLEDTSSSHE